MRILKYLEESPVFAISAAFDAILGHVNRDLRKEKIHFLQGLVLTALFFEDKRPVRPSELAILLRSSRANMSHMLSDLEAKGFIKRTVDIEDARQFHLSLRPEGKKKALVLIQYFNRLQERFEKELGVVTLKRSILQLNRLRESRPK